MASSKPLNTHSAGSNCWSSASIKAHSLFPRSSNDNNFSIPIPRISAGMLCSSKTRPHVLLLFCILVPPFFGHPSRCWLLQYPTPLLISLSTNDVLILASLTQLSKRAIEVNVDLVIGGEGKNEHWSLLIGPQLFQTGARDFATMDATKSKLTTSSYNWDEVESQLDGDYYILPLGKATYKDADDRAKAFAKIREIRMKKAAAKKGGNCMDYNMDVLKLEKKQRHITQEVVAYKLEYDDNYTRVSKAVWGVDLRP
ncbi:hypothetical protein GG344DRAFT_76412 [Lentinula edodes]|nr:hypothetical protein GG344DRAFT_76412 [Lentinula edodes]